MSSRIILWCGILFLVVGISGCVTTLEIAPGQYLALVVVETRSTFGTNVAASRLVVCRKEQSEFRDCRYLSDEEQRHWQFAYSAGQGGQLLSGGMIGLGGAIGGALVGATR